MMFSVAADIRLRMILLKTACERQQCYPLPVIAVSKIAFLCELDNSASFPSLWGVFSVCIPVMIDSLSTGSAPLGHYSGQVFPHTRRPALFSPLLCGLVALTSNLGISHNTLSGIVQHSIWLATVINDLHLSIHACVGAPMSLDKPHLLCSINNISETTHYLFTAKLLRLTGLLTHLVINISLCVNMCIQSYACIYNMHNFVSLCI